MIKKQTYAFDIYSIAEEAVTSCSPLGMDYIECDHIPSVKEVYQHIIDNKDEYFRDDYECQFDRTWDFCRFIKFPILELVDKRSKKVMQNIVITNIRKM